MNAPKRLPISDLVLCIPFVRPMPIRLSNFCHEQSKQIVADSMIAV